jgi:hypothetical protein
MCSGFSSSSIIATAESLNRNPAVTGNPSVVTSFAPTIHARSISQIEEPKLII